MSGDPIRLLDDPSAGSLVRGDLQIASAVQVQGLDVAGGLSALKSSIAAQTGAIPVVASAGFGGSLVTKALFGTLVVAGLAWWGTRDDGDAPVAPPVAVAPAVAAPTPVFAPPPIERAAPAFVAPVEAPAAAPELASPDEPAIVAPPAPEAEAEPEAEPAPEAEPETESRIAKPQPRLDAPHTDPTAPSFDDAVAREAKLVAAARRALGSDPSKALALTESIAREFPEGQLVEERHALQIRALARLGRMDEARASAEGFLAEYGRGPHATAVRRAIDDAGTTDE